METPKYEFLVEEGSEKLPPVKRKIAKTMTVTENFNYYDTLAYVMKMEKAVKDKEAEISGLNSMIKAYREEIKLIEDTLDINGLEKEYQLAIQAKLIEDEKNVSAK